MITTPEKAQQMYEATMLVRKEAAKQDLLNCINTFVLENPHGGQIIRFLDTVHKMPGFKEEITTEVEWAGWHIRFKEDEGHMGSFLYVYLSDKPFPPPVQEEPVPTYWQKLFAFIGIKS